MTSAYRILADVATKARGRLIFCFALLIIALGTLSPSPARAMTQDEAIDLAIEVGVKGGQALGVSIPEDAKEVLKELVKCGANGTPIVDCAKQSLINVLLKGLPDEAKKMVGCLLGGGDVLACAKAAGLDNLPPQAKPIVECMLNGGTVAACAGKAALGEALAKVPADVRPLLECIASGKSPLECGAQALAAGLPDGEAKEVVNCLLKGGSPEDCAAQFGKGVVDEETKKQTADLIKHLKDLKADAEQALEDAKGTVKSIIEIAKAIQNEDWAALVYYGGKEFAKVVLTVLVDIFCPPCAPITGQVVAALVDHYLGLAEDLFKAALKGDAGAVPEIVFAFYFTEMIVRPCALLPEGAFKDAICGGLAKVIAAAAGVFGGIVVDAAEFVLGVAKDILKAVGLLDEAEGIVGFVGGVVTEVWCGLFGCDDKGPEDPKVCGSAAAEFFAKNYLPCLGATAGASTQMSPVAALHGTCVAHFNAMRCQDSEGICNGLDKALNDNAQLVNAAIREGAQAFTPALGAFIYSRRAEICPVGKKYSFDDPPPGVLAEFIEACRDALSKKVPLQVNACAFKSPGVYRPPSPSLACSNIVRNNNWQYIVNDVCDAWCAEKENKDKCPRLPCPEWERKVVGYDIEYKLVVPQPGLCEHEKQAILLQSQLTAWKLFYPPNVIYKVYDNRRLVNLLYGNRPVDSILQSPDRIGAAVLASRGSSGFDRVQPGGTSVPRQPQSGSGFNTVQPGGTSVARQPQSGSGFNTVKSNSAMDRLTGDGMGGARSGAPGSQLPDTGRVPIRQGSSGASSVQGQPQSGSGFSTVQPGGTSVPRQPQSGSGFYTSKPGGTAVPRPQQQQPYYPPLR